MSDITASEINIVALGDFNIPVNTGASEATTLLDTMQAMGFVQHVHYPTQKAGNTLDLVFTEGNSKAKVLYAAAGPIFSDHAFDGTGAYRN